MNLLIHDLTAAEWELAKDDYKDWTVISDNGTIRPCIGCFCCWTGGKGECVFRDGYENMGSLIHEADEMVVMSRYTYGGFSSFVKNVFDRSIGYVLPEFETAYGEMHHKKRYAGDRPVTFRFRGNALTKEDKEKARNYVAAVCRNLRGTVKEVIFDECAPAKTGTAVPSPGSAGRSGILLVDCSLRGKRSNTAVFLEKLREYMDVPAQILSLSDGISPDEAAAAVSRAGTVVLGVPLYVDGLPSPAIRLMEAVKDKYSGDPCRIYAVVNNGLYESRQNDNLLEMIKAWCADCGFIYSGALAIGAGEVVGALMRGQKHVLWPAWNALIRLSALAKAVKGSEENKDVFADTFLFPRWLYILIANTNWQRLKKAAARGKQR